jgi:MFS family permease
MPNRTKEKRPLLVWGRILLLGSLAVAVALSGKFTNFVSGYGLIFVLLGGAALALTSYSLREMGAAFKHAAGGPGRLGELRTSLLFWQTSARNVWMLGVLGSIISFVAALTNAQASSQGGIASIAFRMAISFVPTVYGLLLGVICLVPAWKLTEKPHLESPGGAPQADKKPVQKAGGSPRVETIIGYILFLGMTTWAILGPSLSAGVPLKSWEWIVSWPALLVVLGGTTALVLFAGDMAAGSAFTLSFALTGLIGSLAGFIQVLLGFSSRSIQNVSSGLAFIISSCFIALLGMMLLGVPLEDRAAKAGKTHIQARLNQIACYVFPLIVLIFLAMAFVMVVTPIKKVG